MKIRIGPLNELSDEDWRVWKRNCRALKWIVEHQQAKAKKVTPPDFVQEAIAETIGRMRPTFVYPSGLMLSAVRKDGTTPKYASFQAFEDVAVLWQAAFASALVPKMVNLPGFCSHCGKPLPRTRKTGRPSKRTICSNCNTYRWREKNRDKYLEDQNKYAIAKRMERKRKKKKK